MPLLCNMTVAQLNQHTFYKFIRSPTTQHQQGLDWVFNAILLQKKKVKKSQQLWLLGAVCNFLLAKATRGQGGASALPFCRARQCPQAVPRGCRWGQQCWQWDATTMLLGWWGQPIFWRFSCFQPPSWVVDKQMGSCNQSPDCSPSITRSLFKLPWFFWEKAMFALFFFFNLFPPCVLTVLFRWGTFIGGFYYFTTLFICILIAHNKTWKLPAEKIPSDFPSCLTGDELLGSRRLSTTRAEPLVRNQGL